MYEYRTRLLPPRNGILHFFPHLLETEFPSLLNIFLYIVAAIRHFRSVITFIFLHSDVVCNQH